MSVKPYYIARNPDISPARIALAKTAPYDRLETAFSDMGEGVIFDSAGDIIAFHDMHARILVHRGVARMLNA